MDVDDAPEYTALTVLTDKGETGSDGNTGLNSSYLKYFIEDLARLEGCEGQGCSFKFKSAFQLMLTLQFDPTGQPRLKKIILHLLTRVSA